MGDSLQALLILDNGSSSIIALSYELTLAELIDVAQSLRPADEADWVEAGGRLS